MLFIFFISIFIRIFVAIEQTKTILITENMKALELLKKVNEVAREEKKKLTKSFFSGDKSYYKQMLMIYPKCCINADIYETINNISAKIAHNREY